MRTEFEKDRLTAYLSGEIDHHSAKEMREYIDMQIEKMRPKLLVLDFSAITFMDSSGIGLVMGRHRIMCEIGGRVEITGASRTVMRMMKMAGLGRLGINTEGA